MAKALSEYFLWVAIADRYIDVAQIRGVDHQRVMDLIGVLEPNYWEEIRKALDIMLDFFI